MMSNCSGLRTLVIGSAANRLISNACQGVGTSSNPCTLVYPEEGFTLQNATPYDGYFTWKSGTFKEAVLESYAVLSTDQKTLTFYYDKKKYKRQGTVYELNSGYDTPEWNGSCTSVEDVVFDPSFADAHPTSCYSWFSGMDDLASIAGIGYLNTEDVTNMSNMFYGCYNLTSLDVSHFDTSKVTDMSYMFQSCSSLTSLDVSHFITSNVTNMYLMFAHCSNLKSLDVSGFNTSKVTNMSQMFFYCYKLSSLDVSNFDTSEVTNMSNMFQECYYLATIYSNCNWQKNGLESTGMFSNCKKLSGAVVYDATKTDASMANSTDGYFTAKQVLSGDVNNDNTVDIDDAEALANYLVGKAPASFVYGAADANNDGYVSIADVTTIIDAVINPNIPVTSIRIEGYSMGDMLNGDTAQLTAIVEPANATNKSVTWTSSKPNVITVDENGFITCVYQSSGAGLDYSTITATAKDGSGVSGSISIICH